MTIYTKVNGAWVQVVPLRVKAAGVWRTPRVLVKVGGSWRAVADRPGRVSTPSVSASVTTLSVSWSSPSSRGYPITDYDVQYKRTSSSTWLNWSHNGTSRSTTITGLSSGATYEVRVRAQNAIGEGSYSLSDSDMTAAVPGTPSVSLSRSGSTFTISYTTPASNGATITEYDVERSVNGGSWSNSGTTFTGSQGSSYRARVRARNSVGWGSYGTSNTVSYPATVPGAPPSPSVSQLNPVTFVVSWSAPSDDGGSTILSYRVNGRTPSGLTTSRTYSASTRSANPSPPAPALILRGSLHVCAQ